MTFRPSTKDILVKAILINLFLLLIFILKDQEVWKGVKISFIITFLYLLLLVFSKRATLIKVENSKLTIRFNRLLFYNIEVTEDISGLEQSYKIEAGPKGIRRKVFRINKGTHTILKVVPNYNGWNTNKIESLSAFLQKIGVNLIV